LSDTEENTLPEIRLIEILLEVFSKELGENTSNKKLGRLLLTSNRFNRTIREKSKFRSISIDKIEENMRLEWKGKFSVCIQ